jgi:hypothetical protein
MAVNLGRISAVNTVIEKELLPAHVSDHPQAGNYFTNWHWHSFQPDPVSTKLVGRVSARRLSDNLIIWCELVVYQDDIERLKPAELFNLIDCQMESVVDYIINYEQPHVAGVLCRNNFCEECYC